MEEVRLVIPNDELLAEVIRMVNEGQRVILPVKGNSMLPFIIGGQESVELVKPTTVERGDVVLAWINGCRYVVHRVLRIDGDRVSLMGDGNFSANEYCRVSEVAARAEYVVNRKGHRRYLYSRGRVWGSRLWWKLFPLRRYLLGFYRYTLLKWETRA